MSDLDNLEHMAAQADSGAAEIDAAARGPELDENGQPLPPAPDFTSEAAAMVDMGAAMLAGYAPKTAEVWTAAAKQRTAMALAPVLEKYGFTFGGMPPEVLLLITAGPLLWQSARIVSEQTQAEKAKKAPPPEAPKGIEAAALQPVASGPEIVTHSQMGLYKQ